MEKYIPKTFRQYLALLLCAAMLIPMVPVSASATEVTEPVIEVENTTPAQTEPDDAVEETEAPAEATEAPTEAQERLDTMAVDAKGAQIKISDTISVPGYPGGTGSNTMEYDCGNGVANDGSKSYLTIVTGTNAQEFAAYKALLEQSGYLQTMAEEIASDDSTDPNLFASYTDAQGKYKLYTYYLAYYKETRIIVDTQADTVAGFHYEAQAGKTVQPMLAMWGLSMASNGYDARLTTTDYAQEGRRNCGALVVIRMPDNSLFIHDGGDIEQWSDEACEEFLAFCRNLTGTPEGEKVVINTWFLSHAHSDHFLGLPRFFNKCHDHFDLKNIMYNIDVERTGSTRDVYDVMQLVSGHYPNVRYYKPHTGESFTIAGVKFDVMYAMEDRYLPNENGELITDTGDKGGTYRAYSYDKEGDPTSESDFNDTSVVLRVTFDNNVSSILYADANRAEQTMEDIYPDSALKTDIMMIPHHGFDSHPDLCELSQASIFLFTQHKTAVYGPDGDADTKDAEGTYRPKVRNNFLEMRNAINASGRVEGQDYKFYWGGNNTVVIDINSMTASVNARISGLPGFSTDPDSIGGSVVYLDEAMSFEYTGWSVTDLEDGTDTENGTVEEEKPGDIIIGVTSPNTNLISATDKKTVKSIATTNKHIRFDLLKTTPAVNGMYLIRSVKYPQYVMSYAAVAETAGTVNPAGSLIQDETNTIESSDTNLFFDNGTADKVYMDLSNRDNAIWILKQWKNDNKEEETSFNTKQTYSPYFGGTACYSYTWFSKGVGPTYNASGSISDVNDGVFWYAVKDMDASTPVTQYRYLNPRYLAAQEWIQNVEINEENPSSTVKLFRHVLESFGDGTYLIYYRNKNAGEAPTDVRVLTCDADGNWRTVRYTDATNDEYPSVSQMKADLPNLKVKLYEYKQLNQIKALNITAATVYNVEQGTTKAELLDYILQNVSVVNTDRHGLPIPCSGTSAKVGYYWLDFGSATFNSSKAGTYTISVKYRNDDGTDTLLQNLTVNVADFAVTGTTLYTVMEGTSQADLELQILREINATRTLGGTTSNIAISSEPTVGSCWLEYNFPFNSSTNGQDTYTITVNYRNPDGTDIPAATKLTVIVRDPQLTFDGPIVYYVAEGVSTDAIFANIADKITVKETVQNKTVSYAANPVAGSYWLKFDSAFDLTKDWDYKVSVNYRNPDGTDTLVKTLRVSVDPADSTITAPESKKGIVLVNSDLGAVVQDENGENVTILVNNVERKVSVGMLTKDGEFVDTSKPGTYTDLTLTYGDQVVCTDFTLEVTASNAALDYPAKGQGGYVGVDKQGTTTEEEFAKDGIANIQLSATGIPMQKGVDLIVIMDLSGSMENALNTNEDAPTYQETRVYAMEQSLKELLRVLAGADVRIAMSDFGDIDHYELKDSYMDVSIKGKSVYDADFNNGNYTTDGYEYYNHLNYIFTDTDPKPAPYGVVQSKHNRANPSYTGFVVPTVYTGSGEVEADAFVHINTLYNGTNYSDDLNKIIAAIDKNVNKSIGTNYDIGLEYAYHLGYAIQQENIRNGEDRDIVCIFMSDGAPMQYNYFSGNPQSTGWVDWLNADIDQIASTGYSEGDPIAAFQKIENDLLQLLKEGKLIRSEYQRDRWTGWVYATKEAAQNKLSGDENRLRAYEHANGNYLYRMRFDNSDGAQYFYTYMDKQALDLDWEYLCDIAAANGIENFSYESYLANPAMPELIEKLTAHLGGEPIGYERVEENGTVTVYEVYQTDLVNPSLMEAMYYPAAASYEGNDFFEAMASIGIDCGWDLFAKIAYKNVDEKELMAAVGILGDTPGTSEHATHSPYAHFYNDEGKNWWAEAIKGDPTQLYPVVNKYAYEDSVDQPFTYYGDERVDYQGKAHMSGFRGLGIDLYTVSFSLANDNKLTAEDAEAILKRISSNAGETGGYFFSAGSQDELSSALKAIVTTMSAGATRAFYTDTMGDDYDLYTGQVAGVTEVPTIRVMEYDLDENGQRIGEANVRETIVFRDVDRDGVMDAISDQVYEIETVNGVISRNYPNIWDHTTGLITGKYVIYNTNVYVDASNTGVRDLYLDNTGRNFPLEAETFFWTIGNLGKTEIILEYQVYLTGSLEGTLVTGGKKVYYDTNEQETLTYVNYLGNLCTKSPESPRYPWKTSGSSTLVADKKVEATTDANEFVLTLDAYATGKEVSVTKPTDIVLVLDHSASMRTPVGAPDVLQSTELYSGTESRVPRDQLSTTYGALPGYYIAQNTAAENGKYYWYVLLYHTDKKWYGYKAENTQVIIDYYAEKGNPNNYSNYSDHLDRKVWTSTDKIPDSFVFYKTQFAVLYDSVKEFVEDLKKSGVEHRVAITGFSGSTFGGSVLYGTDDTGGYTHFITLYDKNEEYRRTRYQQALKSIQDANQYTKLQTAIDNIDTRYLFTCPAAGLRMAADLFKANQVDLEERDRVVILFTDGIPNKKIGSNHNNTDNPTDIYNEIVSIAREAKQNYGAKVYTISTTTLTEGADRSFLHYASSDYPNATSYTTPGNPIANQKYTRRAEKLDDFGLIFNTITQDIANSGTNLGSQAVLKEVLTDYFVLNPDDEVDVSVYTQKAKGDGTFEEALQPFADANVKLSSSDGTGRKDTVEVSGFDYNNEFVSSHPRTGPNGEQNYYGSKLVVKVRIRTRDGFWGGNNVPTNESNTAIYASDGKEVEKFPVPEVNVPINVDVIAKDKTIYYSGSVDGSDNGSYEGDELIDKVIIGGKEVNVHADGTFTPKGDGNDWMDDFADAKWTDDSTKPNSNDLSNTVPQDYTYTVVVAPKYNGRTPMNDNPSNIAGNVDGGDIRPEDLTVDKNGVQDSDDGHIFILVPELTFDDSTTDFDTPAGNYGYEANNHENKTVVWKDMENGKEPGDTIPAVDAGTVAPSLDLTYTPDSTVLEDGKFVTDTKVDVKVNIGSEDITNLTTFHWDSCTSQEHIPGMDIVSHKGNANSHEFWVHVALNLAPDTVVIDYGLDVVIDVLANDPRLGEIAPVLVGIGAENAAIDDLTAVEATGGYGKLYKDDKNVRYSLNTSNGMQISTQEVFGYRADYTINGKTVSLSSTVTVIPATTIYYEDSFVAYSTWSVKDLTKPLTNSWDETVAGTKPNQNQDRPGVMGENDANNIYGFDSAYTSMATYSLGSYNKVTVNAEKFAEAQFTFTGTGFDVISLTNSASGTIMVDVFKADDFEENDYSAKPVKSQMVDTFYGYKRVLADIVYVYDGAGNWIRHVQGISKETAERAAVYPANPKADEKVTAVEYDWFVADNHSDTLYQVPVMKISGLEYGTYTVIIMVAYNDLFDHMPEAGDEKTSYDFWLDAIRIYDPANDGATSGKVEGAYKDDHEGWPEYFELRNLLISPSALDNTPDNEQKFGVVFIDNRVNGNNGIEYFVSEYRNYGPNNELYLAPNQSVTFMLDVPKDPDGDGEVELDRIHLAMKSVGKVNDEANHTASVEYYNVTTDSVVEDYHTMDIATATDLYYDITALNGDTVVIRNTGGAILSITNVKVTYSDTHEDGIEKSYFPIDSRSVKLALKSLRPKVEAPVLAITRQPVDYVGMVGDTASFTVAAQGEGLTYQWYYRDADTGWSKTSNGTEATLNVEFLAYRNNRQFRCEITDLNGSTVTTDTVTLSAQAMDLVITGQPVSAAGAVNEEMAFTVEAAGNGLTYQWYYSADNGATWQKSGTPGFNTATLLPILRDYRNGYQYQCRISDVFGNVVTTDAVTMTVKTGEITITAQPADVSTAALNKLYTFQVTATGENLAYRWEYSTDGGETWQLSWNDGYDADTLTVRMYAYRDGYLYRCKVTSGLTNSVYTEAADLKLQAPSVEIVKQPVRVSAVAGETILFHVEATGSDLIYTWYRSDDQCSTWTKTYLNGYDTDTLTFDATAGRAAHYKCQITDGSGTSVWTNAVKLQVISAKLQIVSQPENAVCGNGATAAFKVEAQGDGLKYQWYASADGGETWTKTWLGGYNTDTLSFVVNGGRAAKIYKCVITDAAGNSVTSHEVSIYVEA